MVAIGDTHEIKVQLIWACTLFAYLKKKLTGAFCSSFRWLCRVCLIIQYFPKEGRDKTVPSLWQATESLLVSPMLSVCSILNYTHSTGMGDWKPKPDARGSLWNTVISNSQGGPRQARGEPSWKGSRQQSRECPSLGLCPLYQGLPLNTILAFSHSYP